MGANCSDLQRDLAIGNNPKDPSINICSNKTGLGDGMTIFPKHTCKPNLHLTKRTIKEALESGFSSPPNLPGSNFCSMIGDKDDSVWDQTEWIEAYSKLQESCEYWDKADAKNRALKSSMSGGCCDGGCILNGGYRNCVRKNYFADHDVCCFKDYECNTELEDNCFQTPDRQKTCHPDYRNLNSNNCRENIRKYCVGEKEFPGYDWKDIWKDIPININSEMATGGSDVSPPTHIPRSGNNLVGDTRGGIYYNLDADALSPRKRGIKYPHYTTQPCLRAIARGITNSNICTDEDLRDLPIIEGNLNTEAYQWSKEVIEKVFEKYLDEVNSDNFMKATLGDIDFEKSLFGICSKVPSLCVNPITNMCKNVTKKEVRENPNIEQWCGCYLSDVEYLKDYGDLIPKECQDTCVGGRSIPLVGKNLLPVYCLQNICQITKTKIELLGVDATSIDFTQLCPGCGKSTEKFRYEEADSRFVDTYLKGDPREELKINLFEGEYNVLLTPSEAFKCRGEVDLGDLPTGKITVNSSKRITEFTYENKGTIKFNEQCLKKDNVPNTRVGMTIKHTFKRIFENNLPSTEINPIVEDESLDNLLYFITSEYKKRKIDIEGGGVEKNIHKYYSYQSDINRCICTLSNISLSFVNSEFGSLNINDNCGKVECKDVDNNLVECGNEGARIKPLAEILKERYQEEIKEKYSNIAYVLLVSLIFIFIVMYIFSIVYRGIRGFMKRKD